MVGIYSGKSGLHALRFIEHVGDMLLCPTDLKRFYQAARKAKHALCFDFHFDYSSSRDSPAADQRRSFMEGILTLVTDSFGPGPLYRANAPMVAESHTAFRKHYQRPEWPDSSVK